MKQIKILFAIFLFAISFTTFAQSKVAHVNSAEIVALMPATIAADEEIKKAEETYQKEIEGMRQDLINKEQKYASEQDTVSPELNQTRMAELQDQLQRVQAYINEIQQELQRKRMELMQPISEDYTEAVNTVAERLGFDYVFENNQQVLLVAKGTDITEEVKKHLGL
tara:strand:+ start:836 stop:1336 length:501 start_codon:yes stop_codon:yes gene_type:complete